MDQNIVLGPPIAFAVIFISALVLSFVMSRLALRVKQPAKGSGEPYACGEDIPTHLVQPDYAQFLPFAFFFTILHVVALVVSTVPAKTAGSTAAPFVIAAVYILAAMVGLVVLYRK